VVDASQGIEAQTISNLYLAMGSDLEIIPVLNKIDLPGAMPEEVKDQIVDLVGCKREEIIHASGKEGIGIEDILNAVVDRIPAPQGKPRASCRPSFLTPHSTPTAASKLSSGCSTAPSARATR
jgi:GTP-binding protein LepA